MGKMGMLTALRGSHWCKTRKALGKRPQRASRGSGRWRWHPYQLLAVSPAYSLLDVSYVIQTAGVSASFPSTWWLQAQAVSARLRAGGFLATLDLPAPVGSPQSLLQTRVAKGSCGYWCNLRANKASTF